MSKKWDNNIAFNPDTWAVLTEHLHPGGFIFAFGGSRTYHRLAVAAEDAGLIIHPAIGWIQGQGFPKATRIDTQVDKANGRIWEDRFALGKHIAKKRREKGLTQREVNQMLDAKLKCEHFESSSYNFARVPTPEDWEILKDELGCSSKWDWLIDRFGAKREVVGKSQWTNSAHHFVPGENHKERVHLDVTAPATPLAQSWAGHRYGLQAMKPCLEFVLVAQKPYENKPVQDITATGAGSLWIDGARVATGDEQLSSERLLEKSGEYHKSGWKNTSTSGVCPDEGFRQGRWPPNLALVHTPDCQRVGVRRVKASGAWTYGGSEKRTTHGWANGSLGDLESKEHPLADPDGTEQVDDFRCVEGCPVLELGRQSGERAGDSPRRKPRGGVTDSTQFKFRSEGDYKLPGYSDKGTAARFFPQFDWQLERLEAEAPFRYQAKSSRAERNRGLSDFYWRKDKEAPIGFIRVSQEEWEALPEKERAQGNIHPTQKPISLCAWLATLLLPPVEYAPRRLMVPFCGMGSEMLGAIKAGWEEVVGIDFERDYCNAVEARIAHLLSKLQLEMAL